MLLDYLWDWISTHAPHAGSDTTSIRPMAACPNFNSRSPCRERPLVAGKEMLLLLFQSTLPLRGATAAAILKIHRLPISIHAPHAGSDHTGGSAASFCRYFNPRPQCGERQSTLCADIKSVVFQPTLPMRGATGPVEFPNLTVGNFNPRSPCGERHRSIADVRIPVGISTHAPHAGSDEGVTAFVDKAGRFQPTLPMRGATTMPRRAS